MSTRQSVWRKAMWQNDISAEAAFFAQFLSFSPSCLNSVRTYYKIRTLRAIPAKINSLLKLQFRNRLEFLWNEQKDSE